MKFDDEQLDEILRDVDVPESLRRQLLEIPEVHETKLKDSRDTSKGLGWIPMLAIAASLLLLMSLAISSLDDANGDRDPISIVKSNDVKRGADEFDVSSDVDFELDLLKTKLQSIDLVLMQMKTKRMQRKLAQLKRTQLPVLSSSEKQSIVLSMSCQSAIELGASLETVRDELEQVKLQYPNSQGASIAKRLLQEQEFFN